MASSAVSDFTPRSLGLAGESNGFGKSNGFGTTSSSFMGKSKGFEMEASSHRHLTQALISKGNGSFLRGWRSELDPDGTLQVPYQTFCHAATRLGLGLHPKGKRHSVVDKVTEGRELRLKDVAPECYILLQRFRDWVQSTGGPVEMLLMAGGSKDGAPVEAFREYLRTSHFDATPTEVEEIIGICDVDQNGTITNEEVVFLELDQRLREVEFFKMRMKQKHTRQQLLATMYSASSTLGNTTTKYRETLRPWQRFDFERLPQVSLNRKRDMKLHKMKKAQKAKREFINHLVKTYGTVIRAWRRDLDKEGTFSIPPSAIRQFCVRMPFPIDSALVLFALDEDTNNSICLEELAPEAAAVLANFQRWAIDCFESCESVWDLPDTLRVRNTAPPAGSRWSTSAFNKKLPLPFFAKVVTNLGWPMAHDPEKLSLLLSNLDIFGCGFLSASDLAWLDKWSPPAWLYCERNGEALKELRSKFDGISTLQAWQKYFDIDNSNRVSWDEFTHACRRLGFNGDLGGAWRAWDTDLSGSISLSEFDNSTYELLHSFKQWCEEHYGSVKLLCKALQKDGGEVTLLDLKRAATRLCWDGDVRDVIDAVTAIPEGNKKKVITYKELEFLDTWIPKIDDSMWRDEEVSHQISSSKSAPALPRIGASSNQTSQKIAFSRQAAKMMRTRSNEKKQTVNAGMFMMHAPIEHEDDPWENSPRGQKHLADPLRETSLGKWRQSPQPYPKSGNKVKTLPRV
eukprot:TRINITY_DN20377_c0_g2_i1.p1 TRINITY_DN20377_c0_g2~~TRINITY_DN20377_c0_g2_i1.p1  ORF type:complete len:740 (-),score=120.76 TRINITY_DN20377_c0_g2_i1:370-2589(-)